MRLQKHVPENAAGNDQQRKAQQQNQNVLASLPIPVKGGRVREHAVNSHRIGDVLDHAIAQRLVSANQFMFYLFVDAARDVNLAGIGNALKARSNVDPVAVNVVWFDDNVAKIDANSVLDPMMLRQRCVAANQILLDDDAAPDGFDGTVKDRDKTVAGGFDELSVVLCNAGLDEVALDPLDAIVCSFLIDLHQAAVAGDIARDDRSKTTRCRLARRLAASARLCVANLGHGSWYP